jgi:hypothetical protein
MPGGQRAVSASAPPALPASTRLVFTAIRSVGGVDRSAGASAAHSRQASRALASRNAAAGATAGRACAVFAVVGIAITAADHADSNAQKQHPPACSCLIAAFGRSLH